jgi:hypothetical protein
MGQEGDVRGLPTMNYGGENRGAATAYSGQVLAGGKGSDK